MRLPSFRFSAVAWGVADQAFSSITNFATALLVARTLDPPSFGAFSLCFATYIMMLGIARALSSEILIVRYPIASLDQQREEIGQAAGTGLCVGIVGSLGSLLVASLLPQPLKSAFIALAVTLPGLLVQDCWRFLFFAQERGKQALLNDLLWAMVLFPSLAILIITRHATVAGFLLVWGGSAFVAALVGLAQSKAIPDLLGVRRWLTTHRVLYRRFAAEFAAMSGASQAALYVVGAISGLATVGALRAGQLLLGPLNVLFMGVTNVAVPQGVRLAARSKALLWRRGAAQALLLSSTAVLWGLIVMMIPDSAGRRLMGLTWEAASPVVLPATLAMAALGASSGGAIGLRALAAAQRSLRVRTLVGGLSVLGALLGAGLAGAPGAAFGFAGAYWIGVGLWWWEFRIALKDTRSPSHRPPETEEMLAEHSA